MHFIKIIIVISLFLSPFTPIAQSTNTFNVAVEVNDQIITNYEISQRIKMLETFGAKSVSKKEVINSLINERLYTYSAIELEALPNNSEIDKGLDDFVKRGNLNKKDLLAYLDSRNVSQETLIAYITSGLTQRKVIQKKFVNNIIISQGDVASAIDKENVLSKSNSNVIEYIELTFSNLLSNKKSLKQLNTINNSSVNAIEGYQDFSCQKQTDLTPGNSYLLSVRTGPDNPQDTKAWIDYNNDGVFDNATELVMEALNTYDPELNITIPASGITNNTWLRMRISSDEVGSAITGCTNCTRGQSEDYSVRIVVVGVEEGTNPFQIYPNPANDKFFIKSSNQQIKNITLYNLIGEQIIELSNIKSKDLSVDVSNLTHGAYLLFIENESGYQTAKKIIIQ